MVVRFRLVRSLLAGLCGLALTSAALAYDIDYSPDRPEALKSCDEHLFHGRQADAARCYAALVAGDPDLRIKAEAAWALNNYQIASNFFQDAVDAYPDDPRVRTRWGQLWAVTHKPNDAKQLYQQALGIDDAYVPAIVALADLAAGSFEGQARTWVEQALDIDPDAIGAHLLLARMELEVTNLVSADESIDRALGLIEAGGYPPLEAYALKASVDLLNDNFESPWIQRALDYDPSYGDAWATPAYFFVITRRYREAIDFYQRAVAIEPGNFEARTELGVNLLRENRVEEAYEQLSASHNLFGFDPQTTNTLNLIDSFDHFTVNRYDRDTTPQGAGDGVILRLHEDETAVLTPYVLDLVNDSIAAYTERYAFELKEPVIAELYPVASDFSVRTAGLPGIGLLGVTFGYLVAMNSPPPGLDGEFHWGTTLWHEMAHVFTLEVTDHLVPRWFSEGVSVYEEWSTGPLRGRHIPTHVLQAMSEDKFLPIAELDEGFIRPTYENQVIVSYMQAGLICEYIANNFGQAALRAMLTRFKAGDDTAMALEDALGIPAEEFDERFADFVEAEFGTVFTNLHSWMQAQQTMLDTANESNWEAVLEPAREAIDLMPDYVDTGSAYLFLARAERETGDTDAARETLTAYFERGGYAPDALRQLARWRVADGDTAGAIDVYDALLMVAPLDDTVHGELGDLLLADRPADALREFNALAALAPHDQANLNLRLARAYLGLGDPDKAQEHLLYALEIAPTYREAQKLLLEIVR